MKTYELANGDRIPALGLGTWKMEPDTAEQAVQLAIDSGYRHIDCALIYGNESGVGQALQNVVASGINRQDLWITSKLWNDCHQPEHVQPALKKTLQDLGLDHLDLYLIHWPIAHCHGVSRPESANDFLSLQDVPLTDTWQALIECRDAGLCRHIGVSNFSKKKLQELIDQSSVKPEVNQIESHPILAQPDLLEYCQEQQILFTAYSPLGSGDRPDLMKKDSDPNLFELDVIRDIATHHGVTSAQILIAWGINRGTIVIPKSASKLHLMENLQASELELTETEMEQIAQLNQHYRFVDGTFWETDGGPYTVADLWDE